ncbi:hypothetical protein AB6D22_03495 [Vibrio splendidus]
MNTKDEFVVKDILEMLSEGGDHKATLELGKHLITRSTPDIENGIKYLNRAQKHQIGHVKEVLWQIVESTKDKDTYAKILAYLSSEGEEKARQELDRHIKSS